jgi:DsbC/DsbD-like thiol-disulfide interchange protein/cytochrome c biogenesis protein CcdA
MTRAILLLFGVFALLFATPVAAQGFGAGAAHIRTSIEAETMRPAPGAETTLAFVMTPDAGWHGYWKNGGDAGLGMEVDWTLPDGVSVGELAYPVPRTLVIARLMNHVYEAPYALTVPLRLSRAIAPGTMIPIEARARWLACTDKVCVPESGSFTLRMRAGDGAIDRASRARFDGFRAKLPQPLGSRGSYTRAGAEIRFAIPLPADVAAADPHLFVATVDAVEAGAPQRFARDGDRLIVATRAAPNLAPGGTIDALIRLSGARGLAFSAAPGEVPPIAGGLDAGLLLAALGAAILGGLILNIMPCVFPILSLKALSLARAGGDERRARREALAYAAGVILVCVALGGLLLALRAGGENLGWAFQLQDRRIVFVLLLLVVAITANLAGLFELPGFGGGEALAGRGGVRGAFWTGALAAFVATPCTGPFMGAALGATLVLPAAAALAIFGGLGLGLALPFLLIGYVPALRNRLPRPGPWMDRFRRWMALPMGLTALALLWLFWKQGGNAMLAFAIMAGLFLAAALWKAGRDQRRGTGAGRALAPALLVGVVALIALVRIAPHIAATQDATDADTPYSAAKIAALRAEGKPAFVYFTADWCVTCKANEAATIDRDAVRQAFSDNGVAVLVGDWTDGDPALTRALAGFERNSVPLYLWYPRGRSEAEILPQVLTPSMLIERASAR